MINFIKNFLFIDQNTKQISHTKFWSNIGYGVMCYTFTYAVLYGTTINETLWILFGIVVIGNRSLIKLVTRKNDVGLGKND